MTFANRINRKQILVFGITLCIEILVLLLIVDEFIPLGFTQFSFASSCNCTMDYVSNAGGNLTPVTMPRLNIVKNETLESQTEGTITWTGVKSAPLMNIFTDKFLLGNLSGGTSVTVALNTINITSNGFLGIQITGGSVPDRATAEILKASVNTNGTLRQVETSEKIAEFPLLHDKASTKGSPANNNLALNISEPGYYLLLVSVSYDAPGTNNMSEAKQLTGVYQSILRVE
jgi:hypothetical protein